MLNNLVLVYGKEMKELIRDRRTLRRLIVSMLFLPVLMQIVVGIVQRNNDRERNEVLEYALIGGEQWTELNNLFIVDEKFKAVSDLTADGIEQAINDKRIEFAIVVPEQGFTNFSSGQQLKLDFFFHDASSDSSVQRRVEQKFAGFNAAITANRLQSLGLSDQQQQNVLQPLQLIQHNAASARERIGNAIGGMLPYILFIMCLTGAMFSALDIGAGEKERGTLETLLLLPVPRRDLVLGKFLVVFTTAVVYSTTSVSSLLLWLSLKGGEVGGVMGQVINGVNPFDLVIVITMLIPIAAIFAALLLSLSCYAKSYKEAASMASLLNILVILPIIISILPGTELTWGWAMVPITNVALVIKEVVKGTMEYNFLIAVFASSALIALGMIYFCSKWFEKESVLFRE